MIASRQDDVDLHLRAMLHAFCTKSFAQKTVEAATTNASICCDSNMVVSLHSYKLKNFISTQLLL